jgi:hypothetical protein
VLPNVIINENRAKSSTALGDGEDPDADPPGRRGAAPAKAAASI